VVRATVEDAERCFGIARAAAVAGFQNVFQPGLYEFPDDAIRADWLSALTDPDGETYIAFGTTRPSEWSLSATASCRPCM
jgi:hypothetical protein